MAFQIISVMEVHRTGAFSLPVIAGGAKNAEIITNCPTPGRLTRAVAAVNADRCTERAVETKGGQDHAVIITRTSQAPGVF